MDASFSTESTLSDDPIESLRAAHDRILERMHTLEVLSNELLDGGLTAFMSQREQWVSFLAFMRDELVVHTLDEENGLFPMVEQHLASSVDLMLFEHRWISQSEETLTEMLDALLAGGDVTDGTHCRQFGLLAREFAHTYRQHINVENDTLLSPSKGILTDDDKLRLSEIMRGHRAPAASVLSA